MELIFKQRIVGSIVILAILSIILPVIVISKDEVFNKKLISNIPSKPVFKISLPDTVSEQDVIAQVAKTTDNANNKIPSTAAAPQPLNSENASLNNTDNSVKPAKQVTLLIPLTDNEPTTESNKTLSKEQDKANTKATLNKNVSELNTRPTKLVASEPKGELTLPDLTDISEAFQKFIKEDPSTEGKQDNVVVTKGDNQSAAPSSANVKQSTAKLSSPKPSAAKLSIPKEGAKKLAKLQVPSNSKLNQQESPKIDTGWVVQVGSFSKKSNATQLQNKLAKRGHKSYVELAKSKNGVIYRVRIGPQKDQTRAKSIQRKILKQEKLESIVLRYPH